MEQLYQAQYTKCSLNCILASVKAIEKFLCGAGEGFSVGGIHFSAEEVSQMRRARWAILTKTVQFEAAHQLPGHAGKCAQLHGHSYRLEVSLRGPLKQAPGESDDGMVMDLQDLSAIIKQAVLARLDHRFLNEVMEERTTAENVAHWIWEALLEGGLPEPLLYRVRLWETTTGWVEVTRAERGEMGE
jgi:6-pyruvoyltetrahydropterin/6-carboxytetrahydropterin synthase